MYLLGGGLGARTYNINEEVDSTYDVPVVHDFKNVQSW